MNDIIGITGTVKHEIKNRKADFFELYFSTFSRFINATSNFFNSKGISGRGVRRAGRGYLDKIF